MPGLDDPERVKELIKGQSKLELKAVEGSLYKTREEALAAIGGNESGDKEVFEINEKRTGGSPIQGFYVVQRSPVINGADLRNAQGVPNGQGLATRSFFSLSHLARRSWASGRGKISASCWPLF